MNFPCLARLNIATLINDTASHPKASPRTRKIFRLNNVNKKKWIFLPLCSTCTIFVHFKTSRYFQ